MKILPVSLSPSPSPARGEGSIQKSLRGFHINRNAYPDHERTHSNPHL